MWRQGSGSPGALSQSLAVPLQGWEPCRALQSLGTTACLEDTTVGSNGRIEGISFSLLHALPQHSRTATPVDVVDTCELILQHSAGALPN